MARILTFNHKIINPGNNRYFGTFGTGPTPPTPPEPTVYDVILTTDGHGTITANPMSGAKDISINSRNNVPFKTEPIYKKENGIYVPNELY